jgi:CheY-like chemotaxis protein
MNLISQVTKFKTNRILAVDDEEFCLNSLKVMLKSLGYDIKNQVDFCINGQEAIDAVNTAYDNHLGYQLIITDYHMPKLNGMEATKAIRKFLDSRGLTPSEQPKIFGLTGHATQEYHDQGLESGMNQVISKPLYIKDLKELLQSFNLL